jgi:hypothetical protein
MIVTEKLNRRGAGKPHRLRFRISWPDEQKLQIDSQREMPTALFALEIQDLDSPSGAWGPVAAYHTKAKAQLAADGEIGYSIKCEVWSNLDSAMDT